MRIIFHLKKRINNSFYIVPSPPQKALAMQVLFSFERGASHPWLTRVVRRRLVFPAQPPLFHGAATTIPHHLRFTSHPRYSVASLLTNPLVSTSRNLKRTTLSESSFRFFLVSLFYFQSNQENAANYN